MTDANFDFSLKFRDPEACCISNFNKTRILQTLLKIHFHEKIRVLARATL